MFLVFRGHYIETNLQILPPQLGFWGLGALVQRSGFGNQNLGFSCLLLSVRLTMGVL